MRFKEWKIGIEVTYLMLIVLGAQGNKCDQNSDDIDFSREFTGVAFRPLVSIEDYWDHNRYDAAQLQVLLKKVHTKFDRILVEIFTHPRNDLIPVAAANMNLENKDNPRKKTQMKVIIVLRVSTTTEAKLHIEIERMQRIADEANSIFPGTVEAIIWDNRNELDNGFITAFKTFCSHFRICHRNKMGPIEPQFAYKIGLSFSYEMTESLLTEFQEESDEEDIRIFSSCVKFEQRAKYSNIAVEQFSCIVQQNTTKHSHFAVVYSKIK